MFLFVVSVMLLIPLGVFVYRNSETLETPLFFLCLLYNNVLSLFAKQCDTPIFALTLLLIGFLLLQKANGNHF